MNKKIIYALGILLLVIISFYFINNNEEEYLPISNAKEEIVNEYIYVDLKGAVNNPGVYKLENDSRIIDLLQTAGGFREEADITIINLSQKLNDEDVVIIYNKFETNNNELGIGIIEKKCECPKINSTGCIETSNNTNKISLNKATKSELETLPGIGASKADLIIEYRSNNGSFKNIEELKNIKGIGEATFDKLKEFITI